jgi:hypothetical protein
VLYVPDLVAHLLVPCSSLLKHVCPILYHIRNVLKSFGSPQITGLPTTAG